MSLTQSPCLFLRRLGVDDLDPVPALNKAQIKTYVAQRHRLRVCDLEGDSRQRDVTWARQEAMWMMRMVKRADGSHRYSTPEIGRVLFRDHSTVLHGVRAHQARLDALNVEVAA